MALSPSSTLVMPLEHANVSGRALILDPPKNTNASSESSTSPVLILDAHSQLSFDPALVSQGQTATFINDSGLPVCYFYEDGQWIERALNTNFHVLFHNSQIPSGLIVSKLSLAQFYELMDYLKDGLDVSFYLQNVLALEYAPDELVDPEQVDESEVVSESTFEHSAIIRPSIVAADGDAILAEAGFETAYRTDRPQYEDEDPAIIPADGGISLALSLREGDLDPTPELSPKAQNIEGPAYPQQISQNAVLKSGTMPLDPDSFEITPATLDSFLLDLSQRLTLAGQSLTFEYDKETQQVIGRLGDDVILDIQLVFTSLSQGDLGIEVITNLYAPLDHLESDQILINFSLIGSDKGGHEIRSPINVEVEILDGLDPSFGADFGVNIDETNQRDSIQNGHIETDLGSDDWQSLNFLQDQPALETITSGGQATQYAVDGNKILVSNLDGDPVLSIEIGVDGQYQVILYASVDQQEDDVLSLALNVIATDYDADTGQGIIHIDILDGADSTGVDIPDENSRDADNLLILSEGDLQNPSPTNYYPKNLYQNTLVEAGSDPLIGDSLHMAADDLAKLTQELSELTSNGDPITWQLTEITNGLFVLLGEVDGERIFRIDASSTENGNGNLTVGVQITQFGPIDHLDSVGEYVNVQDDTVRINLPLLVTDTDGDDATVNIVVEILDGQDPSFGEDTGVSFQETDGKTVKDGQIEFDKGSDEVEKITFSAEQNLPSPLSSNGETVTYVISDDGTLITFSAEGETVMTVEIRVDGSYTVTQVRPFDQSNAEDNLIFDLAVEALDADDDPAFGQIQIEIIDGVDSPEIVIPPLTPDGTPDPDAENVIVIEEGDLQDPANGASYPQKGNTVTLIESPSDDLVQTSLRIDPDALKALEDELKTLTTNNGDPIQFTISHMSDGSILIVSDVKGAEDLPLLEITLTPQLQSNGDVLLTTNVSQAGPLDHNTDFVDGTYVSVNGEGDDNIQIDLPLLISDTDGDDTSVGIQVNLEDGQDPSFGTDKGAYLVDSVNEQSVTSSIEFDNGSDVVKEIVFDAEQPSLEGLTSNGEATTCEVVGNIATVTTASGAKLMEIEISPNGEYTVTTYGSIDQDNGLYEYLTLGVSGTDADDDVATGNIHVLLVDDQSTIVVEDDLTLVEGDLEAPADGNAYPKSTTSQIAMSPSSDALDAESFGMTTAERISLINQLNKLTTNDGEAITFTYVDNGTSLQFLGMAASGEVALEVNFTAEQVGAGVIINSEVFEYLPIDHDALTDTNVNISGDDLVIDFPLHIYDGDGFLTGDKQDINISLTISDGQNPSFGVEDDNGIATGGVSIVESDDAQTATGYIDFDKGSDNVKQITFDALQPSLDNLTSNGLDTNYDFTTKVVDGEIVNVVTLYLENPDGTLDLDSPVLTISIDKDGNYSVTQDRPLDQNNDDGDVIALELGVTATDSDNDVANGNIHINILDGANAPEIVIPPVEPGETPNPDAQNVVVLEEGDLQNPAAGNKYPKENSTTTTIESPSDDLVATTLKIDPEALGALKDELETLTSNGDPIEFTITQIGDGSISIFSNLTGADGSRLLEINLTPMLQDNGDVIVTIEVSQSGPLDHEKSEDYEDGTYVSINGDGDDNIQIDLPLLITDTDDDVSKVGIQVNLVDGQDPRFGDDTGVSFQETDGTTVDKTGSIEFDQGSDVVKKITFSADQSLPTPLTSNKQTVTPEISEDGTKITFKADGETVMTVEIQVDGSYTVTQYKPFDQTNADDNVIFNLNVEAVDADGDTATGAIKIEILDGENAPEIVIPEVEPGEMPNPDAENVVVLEEGDLQNPATDNAYPKDNSTETTIESPSDDLVATTLKIDPAALASLKTELTTLFSDGQQLAFSIDTDKDTGVITIVSEQTGADGLPLLSITLTPELQDNGDVHLTTKVSQSGPLDHEKAEDYEDGTYVSINGEGDDNIQINLPLLITDADGDDSKVGIQVNLVDGQDPSFGVEADNGIASGGVSIVESDDQQTKTGSIEFDKGSDEVKEILFDKEQPSLENLTSNGLNTGYDFTTTAVDGEIVNVVTLYLEKPDGTLDLESRVLTISINQDGSYTVTQHRPLDQNNDDGDVLELVLGISATDADDDVATGNIHINILDGTNPTPIEPPELKPDGSIDADAQNVVVVEEADLSDLNADGENTYPATNKTVTPLESPTDDLVAASLHFDDAVLESLKTELKTLTSNGQPIEFTIETDTVNGIISIVSDLKGEDGSPVLSITFSPVVDENGDLTLTTLVSQGGPLDHEKGEDYADGTYVSINGEGDDNIQIDLPLLIRDTDKDETQINIQVNLQDGADPVFGEDTGTTITESAELADEAGIKNSGDIPLDTNSDEIVEYAFSDTQTNLSALIDGETGLKSNGRALSYELADDDASVLNIFAEDGTLVMTVVLNLADGTYDATLFEPLDHVDADEDLINFIFDISATDADGDTAQGQIKVIIEDSVADSVTDSVTVTEGDLDDRFESNFTDNNSELYPQTNKTSVVVYQQGDALDSTTLRIDPDKIGDLNASSNLIESNGEKVTFVVNDASDTTKALGGFTVTGSCESHDPLIQITFTPSYDTDGNLLISTTVVLYGPIDHIDTGSNSDLIYIVDDQLFINFPILVDDYDGDPISVDVETVITDGFNPEFGATEPVILEYVDGLEVADASGSIELNANSDEIKEIRIVPEQSQLDAITHGGRETEVVVNEAQDTLTIYGTDADGNQITIMVVTLHQDGTFDVNQYESLDQPDGILTIDINLEIEDVDTDVNTGVITIQSQDGENAEGGNLVDLEVTEGDLDVNGTGTSTYPVSDSASFHVAPGTDDLNPDTVEIDQTLNEALLAELESQLTTQNGQSIEFTYDEASKTYIGTSNGEKVLEFGFSAIQSEIEDGGSVAGVDITVSFTQYLPLDHDKFDDSGFVIFDGDQITLNVPIQVSDSDGQPLDEPVTIEIKMNDGVDPSIKSPTTTTVDESAIDSGGENHQGSNPNSDAQTATGQVIIDTGSDHIDSFTVNIDYFNEYYSDPDSGIGLLTSNGEQISLSYDESSNTYFGKTASDDNVFSFSIDPTGDFTFTLLGAIDHAIDTDLDKELTIYLPVFAVDDDGDVTNNVNVPIKIVDDVPTAEAITLEVEEGEITDLGDVLINRNEGADDAKVTSIVVDGVEILLADLPTETIDGKTYHVYNVESEQAFDLDGNPVVLGVLYINDEGNVRFAATDNLDHTDGVITETIDFIVTDGDGDTDQSTITLSVSDQDPKIIAETANGIEQDGSQGNAFDNLDGTDHSDIGIEISMTIDVGDKDQNEAISEVILTLPTPANGIFVDVNGDPLPTDGNTVTLTSDYFVDNGDSTYSLEGVYFVPNDDFSTNEADISIGVEAVVSSDSGDKTSSGSFNISVAGIADVPVWDGDATVNHYTVDEDSNNVDLEISAVLNDDDGSEALVYYIKFSEEDGVDYSDFGQLVLSGGKLGAPDANGYYQVSADDIHSLQVNPNDNYSGDIKLEVYAESQESSPYVPGKETAQTDNSQFIVINVNPVADAVRLVTEALKSNEDTAIDLLSIVHVTPRDDNDDGSEEYFVLFSDLPTGASIELNGVTLTPDENGVYEISLDDLGNAQLIPPLDSNVDFSITVEIAVEDTASLTDENGNVSSTTDRQIVSSGEINVNLIGDADAPILIEGDEFSKWDIYRPGVNENGELLDTPTASITITEDTEAVIDFSFITGEIGSFEGSDDYRSESLAFGITGIPEGVTFEDAGGNPIESTLVSSNPNIYRIDVNQLEGIKIIPPENSSEDFSLPVRVTVTEDDGDQAIYDFEIQVTVEPDVDMTGFSLDSTGYEDQLVELNWNPVPGPDDSEFVAGLQVEIPEGYSLVIGGEDGEVITVDGGYYTLTEEQLAEATSGGLYLQAPENSDTDVTINTIVTISDKEADDPIAASDVINGTLNVTLTSVVEDVDADNYLDIQTNGESVDVITSEDGRTVDLMTNTSDNANGIVWVNDDTSSDELVTQVVIRFDTLYDENGDVISDDSNYLDRFFISNATDNGDGSWTISSANIDKIHIVSPPGFSGTVGITVETSVQDGGDDDLAPNEPSEVVVREDTVKIHFNDTSGTNPEDAEQPGDIHLGDIALDGDEDGVISISDMINEEVTIGPEDSEGDQFSLVISDESLPEGADIEGMEYNPATGEWVAIVEVNDDGSFSFPEITLILPPDYAGDFELDVEYVNTDTGSGISNSVTGTIPVHVDPVVDEPDFSFTIEETTGLDENQQPTDGEDTPVSGQGLEDGIIHLNLNASSGDTDNDGEDTGGEEKFDGPITLTLNDPDAGEFVDENGNPLGDTITINPEDRNDIYFKPADDFSGDVSVNITGGSKDTANVNGNPVVAEGSFDVNLSFTVEAVNDDLEYQQDGEVVDEIEFTGEEGGEVSFTGLTGSLQDSDGSETIVSVTLTDVPVGFVIEGADNLGNGIWSVDISADESFDLSNVTVKPPEDFSGDVTFTLSVLTQEDSLSDPVSKDIPVTIHIEPAGDKVNANVVTDASGDENGDIELIINAHNLDDANSTDLETENPPEQIQVVVSNVPDGATISFPDGVAGSVTDNGDGTWTVVSEGSDLEKIIFNPGDNNSENWNGELELEIRGSDNDVLSDDVTNETIHVDVNPINDAPVNNVDNVSVSDDTITGLSVSDVDAADYDGDYTVVLSVENGVINAPESTGVSITGNGSNEVTLTGDLDSINALLDAGLGYTADEGASSDTLTITTTDNAGADSAQDSDDVALNNLSRSAPQAATLMSDSLSYNSTQNSRSMRQFMQLDAANTSVITAASLLLSGAAVAQELPESKAHFEQDAVAVAQVSQVGDDVSQNEAQTLTQGIDTDANSTPQTQTFESQVAVEEIDNLDAQINSDDTILSTSANVYDTQKLIEAQQHTKMTTEHFTQHQELEHDDVNYQARFDSFIEELSITFGQEDEAIQWVIHNPELTSDWLAHCTSQDEFTQNFNDFSTWYQETQQTDVLAAFTLYSNNLHLSTHLDSGDNIYVDQDDMSAWLPDESIDISITHLLEEKYDQDLDKLTDFKFDFMQEEEESVDSLLANVATLQTENNAPEISYQTQTQQKESMLDSHDIHVQQAVLDIHIPNYDV